MSKAHVLHSLANFGGVYYTGLRSTPVWASVVPPLDHHPPLPDSTKFILQVRALLRLLRVLLWRSGVILRSHFLWDQVLLWVKGHRSNEILWVKGGLLRSRRDHRLSCRSSYLVITASWFLPAYHRSSSTRGYIASSSPHQRAHPIHGAATTPPPHSCPKSPAASPAGLASPPHTQLVQVILWLKFRIVRVYPPPWRQKKEVVSCLIHLLHIAHYDPPPRIILVLPFWK